MPSKETKGNVPSHDIEYKAGRKVNWKNDLKIGKLGQQIVTEFLDCLDNELIEVKKDQYRNRAHGGGNSTKPPAVKAEGRQV